MDNGLSVRNNAAIIPAVYLRVIFLLIKRKSNTIIVNNIRTKTLPEFTDGPNVKKPPVRITQKEMRIQPKGE
jgi:hypothetical protein